MWLLEVNLLSEQLDETVQDVAAWSFSWVHSRSEENNFFVLKLQTRTLTIGEAHLIVVRPYLQLFTNAVPTRNRDNFYFAALQTIA